MKRLHDHAHKRDEEHLHLCLALVPQKKFFKKKIKDAQQQREGLPCPEGRGLCYVVRGPELSPGRRPAAAAQRCARLLEEPELAGRCCRRHQAQVEESCCYITRKVLYQTESDGFTVKRFYYCRFNHLQEPVRPLMSEDQIICR